MENVGQHSKSQRDNLLQMVFNCEMSLCSGTDAQTRIPWIFLLCRSPRNGDLTHKKKIGSIVWLRNYLITFLCSSSFKTMPVSRISLRAWKVLDRHLSNLIERDSMFVFLNRIYIYRYQVPDVLFPTIEDKRNGPVPRISLSVSLRQRNQLCPLRRPARSFD